jgi:hypothetical protein
MRVCEYKVVEEIEPARIPEILDSEMYGEYEDDTDFEVDWEDEVEEPCGDPDCWCVN